MLQFVEQTEMFGQAREQDAGFGEDETSIGKASSDGWMIRWTPSPAMAGLRHFNQEDITLFDINASTFNTAGMLEGCNCPWLLAAIAVLADHPAVIRAVFKNYPDGKLDSRGWYTLHMGGKLPDGGNVIEVNDNVPVQARTKKGTNLNDWTPLFARPATAEIYPMILEKAFAKMLGKYEELERGSALYAWSILAGCKPYESVSLQKDLDPTSEDYGDWNELEVSDSSWRFGYMGAITDTLPAADLLARVVEALENEDIVAASIGQGSAGRKPETESGLVAGHVYGIRQIVTQADMGGNQTTLVQLRSAWNTSDEQRTYKGPWGPRSPEWNTQLGKHIHENHVGQGNYFTNGFFWMEWEYFCNEWDTVLIARLPSEEDHK